MRRNLALDLIGMRKRRPDQHRKITADRIAQPPRFLRHGILYSHEVRGKHETERASADPPGRITGVGGIFVVSKNPEALAAWYRDALGIPLEKWGGATFRYDAPGHPAVLAWNAFPEAAPYLAPSQRDFMLNFAVDDLDAFLARLQTKGVTILKRDDSDPNGKFAWILDPDGTKIELLQSTKR